MPQRLNGLVHGSAARLIAAFANVHASRSSVRSTSPDPGDGQGQTHLIGFPRQGAGARHVRNLRQSPPPVVDKRRRYARAIAPGADRAAVASAVRGPVAQPRTPASAASGGTHRVGVGVARALLSDRPDPHLRLPALETGDRADHAARPAPADRCRADGRARAGPAARRRPGRGTPSLAPLRSRSPDRSHAQGRPLRGRTTGTLGPRPGVFRTTGAAPTEAATRHRRGNSHAGQDENGRRVPYPAFTVPSPGTG
jgi:hypothetical protein